MAFNHSTFLERLESNPVLLEDGNSSVKLLDVN